MLINSIKKQTNYILIQVFRAIFIPFILKLSFSKVIRYSYNLTHYLFHNTFFNIYLYMFSIPGLDPQCFGTIVEKNIIIMVPMFRIPGLDPQCFGTIVEKKIIIMISSMKNMNTIEGRFIFKLFYVSIFYIYIHLSTFVSTYLHLYFFLHLYLFIYIYINL